MRSFTHAVRVHRSRVGQEIELFDGAGSAVLGLIEEINRTGASVRILDRIESREPQLQIHLALSLIHPDQFELVLQKGTELGVSRFLPLITDRSEVRAERAARKLDRWRKIVLEATKQCGRATIPLVEEPVELAGVLREDGLRMLFDAGCGRERGAEQCVPRGAPGRA